MENKDRHPVDVHVGQKLRQKRQELGISQERLGEAVNLTFQQIQKYEKGYNRISCSKLFEFSSYLKIQVDYFFDGISYKSTFPTNASYEFKQLKSDNMLMDSSQSNYEKFSNEVKQEVDILIDYYKKILSKDIRSNILELVKSLSETP